MSKLIIAAVPVNLVEHMFPKCIKHLQKVVDKAPTDISLETIKTDLINGSHMLITISDGTEVVAVNVVTQNTMPTGYKILWIPITGGTRMSEWLDGFMALTQQLAKDYNCDEIRGMAARTGWLRALKDHDWFSIHEVIGCKVIKED